MKNWKNPNFVFQVAEGAGGVGLGVGAGIGAAQGPGMMEHAQVTM